MANVYYGDGGGATRPALDGNWNTAANWFSTLATLVGCSCTLVPGTALGRVPDPATDSVVLVGRGSGTYGSPEIISTGPTGGWSGTITNAIGLTGAPTSIKITAGTYTGACTFAVGDLGGNRIWISGGTWTGAVTATGASTILQVSGGNFYNLSGSGTGGVYILPSTSSRIFNTILGAGL